MYNTEYNNFLKKIIIINKHIINKFGKNYNGKIIYKVDYSLKEVIDIYYTPQGNMKINFILKRLFYNIINEKIIYNKDLLAYIFSYLIVDKNIYLNLGFDRKYGRIKLYIENFSENFKLSLIKKFNFHKKLSNIKVTIIGFDFYLYENTFDIKLYNEVLYNDKYLYYLNNFSLQKNDISEIFEVYSLNGRRKIDFGFKKLSDSKKKYILKKINLYKFFNMNLSHIVIDNNKFNAYFETLL